MRAIILMPEVFSIFEKGQEVEASIFDVEKNDADMQRNSLIAVFETSTSNNKSFIGVITQKYDKDWNGKMLPFIVVNRAKTIDIAARIQMLESEAAILKNTPGLN